MADKVKIVMVGDRRFRLPFINLIPFDDEQNKQLGESIRESGIISVPIICWKEKKATNDDTVIDGAHRVQWAAKHNIAKIPIIYRSFDSDEEASAECERVNADRRHLSADMQQKLRTKRIERVAELRRQGESQQSIAEQVGVSQMQVSRDLAVATQTGGLSSPTSGVIVGKDGKKRKVTQAVLCKRCSRVGAVEGCQACKDLRKKKENKKPAAVAPGKDDFKNDIPKELQKIWNDPWVQETFDALCVMSEKFRHARYDVGMNKRAKYFPFFNVKDFADGTAFVVQYLDELIQHLKDFRIAGVCPACEGAKCGKCRQSGFVPRSVYQELKK